MTADPQAAPAEGPTRRGRPDRPRIALVPVLLAIVMEAAWISAIAGLLQEFALRAPVLGLAGMAGFVTAGVVLARLAAARLPREWPAMATLLVFGAAVAGVVASPAAREAVLAGRPGAAMALNPGGMLAGLALLRGFPHAGDHLAVDTAARALFIGIPVLAISAAAGGMIAEPWRSAYLAEAALDAAVFVVSGLLALAIAAMADIRPGGPAPWAANPVWLALVGLAVVGLLAFAVPIALAGGPSITLTIQVLVAGSLFPLAIIGFIVGGRAALRRIAVIVAGSVFVVWFLSFVGQGGTGDAPAGAGGGGGGTIDSTVGPAGVAGISGLTFLVIGVVLFLLIRAWMRRQEPLPDELMDSRSPNLPPAGDARPPVRHRRRRPWSPDPRTAIEAYLALVEDIHDVPDVRRKVAETPSEHARRVRLDQLSIDEGIGLELLAADYGLSAFGQRTLSGAETRRAVGRWRGLRRALRIRPADTPARRSRTGDDAPPTLMPPTRSH